MDWNKGHGDFSSYIHFEVTGDSEADCDPVMGDYAFELARSVDNVDDDALSCSYDESDGSGVYNAVEVDQLHEHHESCDEIEEDVVYGRSYCEDDEMQEHHKSYVSFDSGHDVLDEMEKNRLFWEACLAS
ncbi:uncharacterized protein LOC130718787 [Lotus japonicus]|uniref:uncharacterized protein LOC130718787 n=1 Tax=Lotus japonicus TaxID=34305 RepID=UPI0025877FF4|nr:uncharacterized protein LOC130718787 [Lotus japonicus]